MIGQAQADIEFIEQLIDAIHGIVQRLVSATARAGIARWAASPRSALVLISLVALSPIKPEGENRR